MQQFAILGFLLASPHAAAKCALTREGTCDHAGGDQVLLQTRHRWWANFGKVAKPSAHVYKERALVSEEGHGLGEQIGVTVQECAQMCDGMEGCLSFAYSILQRACYLKDKQVSQDDPSKDPGSWHHLTYMQAMASNETVVEVASIPPQNMTVKEHKYWMRSLVADEGVEIFATLQATFADCKTLCDGTLGCQSFAYSEIQSSCHLKDRTVSPGDEAKHDSLDFVTYMQANPSQEKVEELGSSPSSDAGGVAVHTYIRRSLVADEGGTVEWKAPASLQECKSLCDGTDGCRSFAYSRLQSSCYLKDKAVTADDQARHGDADFVTYMQQQ